MRLEAVPPENVPGAWHHAEKWLGRPWKHETDRTMAEMRDMCAGGEGLLILIRDAADECTAVVITSLLERPDGGRTLWLVACAGDGAPSWTPLLAEIEAGARLHGADRVEFTGRPGWARFLAGYRSETRYTKELA